MFTEDNTIEQMLIATAQKIGWEYVPADSIPRIRNQAVVNRIDTAGNRIAATATTDRRS